MALNLVLLDETLQTLTLQTQGVNRKILQVTKFVRDLVVRLNDVEEKAWALLGKWKIENDALSKMAVETSETTDDVRSELTSDTRERMQEKLDFQKQQMYVLSQLLGTLNSEHRKLCIVQQRNHAKAELGTMASGESQEDTTQADNDDVTSREDTVQTENYDVISREDTRQAENYDVISQENTRQTEEVISGKGKMEEESREVDEELDTQGTHGMLLHDGQLSNVEEQTTPYSEKNSIPSYQEERSKRNINNCNSERSSEMADLNKSALTQRTHCPNDLTSSKNQATFRRIILKIILLSVVLIFVFHQEFSDSVRALANTMSRSNLVDFFNEYILNI